MRRGTAGGGRGFKHILIPTDGSRLSEKAARAGVAFAAAVGAQVTAYHAVEEPPILYADGFSVDTFAMRDWNERARAVGERLTGSIGKMSKAAGVRCSAVITKANTSYEGIIEAAQKRRCDVIFMASHGRRGLSRLVMGSVTHKVLTHSRIPVMVYR
ncbi:MAG TPA: universal stress protein [Burkholderiales bacterium]|nr:universal stress protein [Burkholderiales bacterium]